MNHQQATYAIKRGWPGVAFTLAGTNIVVWTDPDPKPTLAEIEAVWATVEADWIAEQEAVATAQQAETDRMIGLRADAELQDMLARLAVATPAQINTYVDNNVTNIATARTLFKRILLILATTLEAR